MQFYSKSHCVLCLKMQALCTRTIKSFQIFRLMGLGCSLHPLVKVSLIEFACFDHSLKVIKVFMQTNNQGFSDSYWHS